MKIRRVIILIVVVIASFLAGRVVKTYIDLRTYRKQVAAITISDVDLNQISEGTYRGSHDVLWIGAEVEVTVEDHRLEKIILISHRNERGASAEVIPSRVLKAQSLKVDTVAGSTSSSKVILKAIENALDSEVEIE